MFACHYDGCDSDSESYSESSTDEAAGSEQLSSQAEHFEAAMKTELDVFLNELKYGSFGAVCVNNKRHVTFENIPTEFSVAQTNPELADMYDEEEDDRNSRWVYANLPGGHSRNSHAVLNCPGCMTVLAVDCRRYSKDKTKYRSSYPINCITKISTLPQTDAHDPPSKQKRVSHNSDAHLKEKPNPICTVCCKICGTSVGNKDRESSVVTFNSVLASHS